MKNKIIKSLLTLVMVVGVFATVSTSLVKEIKAETNASDAPDDWAFTEASIPLHDAILENYGSIDTGDGQGGSPDGYISKDEAAAFTGILNLGDKSITGKLDGIEWFESVSQVWLYDNQISGEIPEGIDNMRAVVNLYLQNNQLTGKIPESIGDTESISNLYLYNNKLTGEIPENITNLTTITNLYLQQNQLIGEIPESIGDLTSLVGLQLHSNQLTGEIPESIGKLTNLTGLQLYNNQLTGEIPESIGKLVNVSNLWLHNNQLTGEIPNSIGSMTSLSNLRLENNQLTGEIPESIGDLSSLTQLRLESNKLTGILPQSISNLSNLTLFYYFYNDIETGDLTGLNSLTALGISKATNANLSNISSFHVSGSKKYGEAMVRLQGTAGFASWDSTTTYYAINTSSQYAIGIPYNDNDGNLQMVVSSYINLSDNALMDNEGNLIIGASLSDVDTTTRNVNLPNGGKVVTGDATYTFDKATTVGETEITTEGTITIANNTTDGSTVTVGDVTTIVKVPEGSEATISLDSTGGTVNTPAGSVVTNNDGSETYLTSDGTVKEDGTITSSGNTITVPSDKTGDVTTDGSEITFPAGTTVDDGSTSITYPGTIIYDTEDDTLQYLPVDGLFNEEGTLKDGITQEDIKNSQDFVTGLDDSALKTELQSKVEDAQNQLNERNAEKAVDDLFDKDGNIKDTVTQEDIKNAEDLVNKLPEGQLKDELNDKLKEAQKQLDERNFVIIEAFKVFTGEGTVYTKIDAPVEKFSNISVDGKELDVSNYEVTRGSTVITLSESYLKTLDNGTYDVDVEFTSGAVVSTELTVRVTLTHPSITPPTTTNPTPGTPTVTKPNTATGSSTNSSSVNTGDVTDLTGLYAMLGLSILGFVAVIRKRKEA